MLHKKGKNMGYKISDSIQPQDREPDVNVRTVGHLSISSSVGRSDRTPPVITKTVFILYCKVRVQSRVYESKL